MPPIIRGAIALLKQKRQLSWDRGAWVDAFVTRYNEVHLHSAIGYVRPNDRHAGRNEEILARRRKVYEAARRRRPERWTGASRDWSRVDTVTLNPDTRANHHKEQLDAVA